MSKIARKKMDHLLEMQKAGRLESFLQGNKGKLSLYYAPKTRIQALYTQLLTLPSFNEDESTIMDTIKIVVELEKKK